MRNEISKEGKIKMFKDKINVGLDGFRKIEGYEVVEVSSLINLFSGYEKTLDKNIINECKELKLESYLSKTKSKYLNALKIYEITEAEALKISKSPNRKSLLEKNEFIAKRKKELEIVSQEIFAETLKQQVNDNTVVKENENKKLEELKNTKHYIGMSRDDLYRCAWGRP